ncbi:DUF4330 domain-containing protein [Candidatus Omnitrophota bacterium]
MRIVDEKGKLFGIINCFDLLVLLVIASFAFFAFRWFQMGEDPTWVRVKTLRMRYVAETVVPDYLAKVVKAGDSMDDSKGLVLARIEKISKNEPADVITYSSEDGDKLFFDKTRRRLLMVVDILSYKRLGEIYSCSVDTPLKVGGVYMLHTKDYTLELTMREVLSKKD